MSKKHFVLLISGFLALTCGVTTLTAQVTIGSDKAPETFSALELISNNDRGLRLPQIEFASAADSTAFVNQLKAAGAVAQGLQIFNVKTRCIETWNGAKWVEVCACGSVPCPTKPLASGQTFCADTGKTVGDLTATGASGATFKWYSSEAATTPLDASTVLTSGTYYVSQTNSAGHESDERTAVTVTVNPTPSAPTASANQTLCPGSTVSNLTATGSNIKWYSAATDGSALSGSTALINSTKYYASQTTSGCESTRAAVTVTLQATPVPTAASPQTFCAGATVSNLAASGTALKWYTAASGGSALSASAALASGTYYVSQTASCGESARRTVSVTVISLSAPTAASPQTVYTGATVSHLLASGESGAVFKWYATSTSTTPLADNTALISGNTYYVSQTVSICESAKTAVAVTVLPLPATITPPANTTTYVGAFWKSNHTGERLIRISVGASAANTGAWSAHVVNGDFIKMDLQNTTDTHVNWTADDTPADMNTQDVSYQVSGNAATVSGNVSSGGYIYFRIGLKSKNGNGNAANTPRYGRILLAYGTPVKYFYIYIRQGEAADYVFRKNEVAGSFASPRAKAAKFSPYNLTSASLSESNIQPTVSYRNGSFVDYPTKAGAIWQWPAYLVNGGYQMKAFHPTGNVTWNYHPNLPDVWDNLKSTSELCPSPYYMPNDGSTSVASSTSTFDESEYKQSLLSGQYPPNYVCGYYADGYFDRRFIEIAEGASGSSASAVSKSTKDAAYIGVLFFNPDGFNSLFFPAAGARSAINNGQLGGAGNQGYYWSTTQSDYSPGMPYSLNLSLNNNMLFHTAFSTSNGSSIRCACE